MTGTRWMKVNKKPVTNLSLTINDLVEESDNEFRVCAENAAGISKPSETTGRFKAKDPFTVPGRPEVPEVVEITKEAIALKWKAPNSDGGSPITNYIVEMKNPRDTKWKVANKEKLTETKFSVTDITPDTEYEFRVTAENKAGQGQASQPSKPVKYVEEIVFTKNLSDIKLKEVDVEVTFECEISKDGLKVEWLKGDKKLSRDERYNISVSGKTHKLIISKVALEDIGEFSATYQKLSTTAKLSISLAPQLDMKNLRDKIVIKAGSSTVIEIPFVGSPKPDVTWKYKGGKLPDAKRFKVDTVANMTSLSIAKAVRSDAGKYTALLENDTGKATATFELIVLGMLWYLS